MTNLPKAILLLLTLLLAACTPQAQNPATVSALTPVAATAVPPSPPAPTVAPAATASSAAALPTLAASPTAAAQLPTATPHKGALGPTMGTPAVVRPPQDRDLQLQEPPMQGEDVRQLQARLLEAGYTLVGKPDAVFGVQTNAAVRLFQAMNGLEADGIVGPKTWARLFEQRVAPPSAQGLRAIGDTAGGFLLGGSVNGQFIPAAAAAALLTGGEQYRLFTPQGPAGGAAGKKPERPSDYPCEQTYFMHFSPPVSATVGVAISGDGNLMPRPVDTAGIDEATRTTLLALLKKQGVGDSELRISRALWVDLEGDGKTEVVVNATNMNMTDGGFPSPDALAGDYSLIAIVRDGVLVQELIGQYHVQESSFSAPEEFRLMAVLDLNDDGKFEIIASGRYYEGSSSSVLSFKGAQYREVLIEGCGV